MCTSILWLLCISLLFSPSLSCATCFHDHYFSTLSTLCVKYVSPAGVNNVQMCMNKLAPTFDNNERVIEAARVDKGYDEQLKKIFQEAIQALCAYEGEKLDDAEYDQRLQTAVDYFIDKASTLPRESCIPPCGFQTARLYSCVFCDYGSCYLPLDCPIEEIKVMEGSRSQMLCNVKFDLPDDIEVSWRFAEEIKTQQLEQFKEVTVEVDKLNYIYSIPSTSLHHQGTYQCEIYSKQRSIVRLYFYLTVTPQVVKGHTELQEIFDLSLLPRGQLVPETAGSPHLFLLPLLLIACLTTSLLLLFLSLGVLYWLTVSQQRSRAEETPLGEDLGLSLLG